MACIRYSITKHPHDVADGSVSYAAGMCHKFSVFTVVIWSSERLDGRLWQSIVTTQSSERHQVTLQCPPLPSLLLHIHWTVITTHIQRIRFTSVTLKGRTYSRMSPHLECQLFDLLWTT